MAACQSNPQAVSVTSLNAGKYNSSENPFRTIGEIPLPEGFVRIQVKQDSFAEWLRKLQLKKDKTVYQYNGLPVRNQDAQFAVINISTGKKDLQQCADAIMRLRSEYFYQRKEFQQIQFTDNAKVIYHYCAGDDRMKFDQYLEKVFSNCGTLSLENQLHKRTSMRDMAIGDVLIKGGSPGHAMIIVDMAANKKGEKIFLLAQGYMPAQDMHIVRNPEKPSVSPWYAVDNERNIETPGWVFLPSQLRSW